MIRGKEFDDPLPVKDRAPLGSEGFCSGLLVPCVFMVSLSTLCGRSFKFALIRGNVFDDPLPVKDRAPLGSESFCSGLLVPCVFMVSLSTLCGRSFKFSLIRGNEFDDPLPVKDRAPLGSEVEYVLMNLIGMPDTTPILFKCIPMSNHNHLIIN